MTSIGGWGGEHAVSDAEYRKEQGHTGSAEMTEGEKQTILERTSLGRVGDPSDIASAVAYLALDAPYVTGQVLAVDGGRSLTI